MRKMDLRPRNLVFLCLLILLALTNPTKEQYYTWVKGQIAQPIPKKIPILLTEQEYPGTRITNCKLFSVYETYFDGYDKLIIGIMGNFFVIHNSKVSGVKEIN